MLGRKEVVRGADAKQGPELKPYAVDIGGAVFQSGFLFLSIPWPREEGLEIGRQDESGRFPVEAGVQLGNAQLCSAQQVQRWERHPHWSISPL